MNSIISMYANGAAGNHGCEALTRSFAKLFNGQIKVASLNPNEDKKYGIDKIAPIVPLTNSIQKTSLEYLLYRIRQHLSYSDKNYYRLCYKEFLNSITDGQLYISAGGDNYSYGKNDWLEYLNAKINQKGGRTALVGCSILEHLDKSISLEDLSRYSFIITRESISYNALNSSCLKVPLYCVPDPAFILNKSKAKYDVLPNSIGINLSPMVIDRQITDGAVLTNFKTLINYILHHTDMNIALIPHVVWTVNDDRVPLKLLYDCFSKDFSNRISFLSDQNAEQVKGAISHCRFMIAARTHASIAAYSSSVPTLVVGYSVKARGIATDLFGSSDHFVLPVQSLINKDDLTNGFKWLLQNEDRIRNTYDSIMPTYISSVFQINEITHRYGFI